MKRNQSGFTLIEIAIVLVIIGLLLGGVLKGQELINSARVKNLAGDFKNIPVFIYGYQDKFKALPGDDIKAVATSKADAVLFPNIESREDVLTALSLLDAAGGSHLPIMVMIESPIAVLNAKEIASASDRIVCIVMATSDLISQLHARVTHERSAILTSLSLVILAARAYGHAVVDGITSDFKNMHSFEYACRLGRDMGFDGKSLVHPAQLPYSNDAYTPQASEVANAREIIAALKAANEAGKGTVVVNDKLVERHHVRAAERLLKLSEMIMTLEESHA